MFGNSSEAGNDSGYEEAYYVASEYWDSRIYKDKLCEPMVEELFSADKDDDAYQEVLAVVRKGATKEQLRLLPSDHPARAMA